MSNAAFVTLIYKNVLGRPNPDQQRSSTIGPIARDGEQQLVVFYPHNVELRPTLSAATRFYGWVANLLDNKNTVSRFSSPKASATSLIPTRFQGMAIAATVTPSDTSVAKGLITALFGTSQVTNFSARSGLSLFGKATLVQPRVTSTYLCQNGNFH